MKKELTERQELILEFIKQFKEENGYPPTLREIGKNFGISSTFGVKRHLDALVKKGYLKIESNASRGISFQKDDNPAAESEVVIERNELFSKIPIVGRVAAGMPLLAIENIEGSIVIDSSFMKKSQDCFALKVKGDSMINAGIFEGDLVIVAPQSNASNGEIVVALLDDEATIKTYEMRGDVIRLIPENSNYSPIIIDKAKSFSIAGKIIGVLRWFN
jgi:repressor LexA